MNNAIMNTKNHWKGYFHCVSAVGFMTGAVGFVMACPPPYFILGVFTFVLSILQFVLAYKKFRKQ